MGEDKLDAFSDLLLAMYRLSAEAPLETYQDEVLQLIKPKLRFDSSMWGVATYRPEMGMDIHTIHLHEQAPEMLTEYEAVKHLDLAAAEATGQTHFLKDFHCPTMYAAAPWQDYLAFQRRHDIGGVVISAQSEMHTAGATQWISLFRKDADQRPSLEHMRMLARLTPHLMQSLRQNRVRHLQVSAAQPQGLGVGAGEAVNPPRDAAIVDARGVLHHSTVGCEALFRQEWPQAWRVGHLPAPLLAWLSARSEPFVGHTLVATRQIRQDLLFVHLRPRCAADDLTLRQREIGGLMAQGLSHKETAKHLGLAPNTVRKQMQNIYDKLGVNNVAALIAALQALR